MSEVTLTKGSNVITLHSSKIAHSVNKKWNINPISVTPNRRAETTLTVAPSAGNTGLVMSSTSNFQARDSILIGGSYGSEYYYETQTISSIDSATTVSLEGGLQYSYDVDSQVTKLARFISFDFSRIVWNIKVEGYLNDSDLEILQKEAADLVQMTVAGGTVSIDSADSNIAHEYAAITALNIEETPEDPRWNFFVRMTLMITNKEIGT